MKLQLKGSQLLNYLAHMTFLYLLFTFLYLFEKSYPPLLPFIVMTVAGACILIAFSSFRVKEVSSMRALLAIGFLLVIGWLIGIPLWQSFLLTIGMSWTIYTNIRESEQNAGLTFVFLGLIGAAVYSLLAPSIELKSSIFLIPGIQLLLLLCSSAFHQLKGEGPKGTAGWTAGAIGFLIVLVASSVFIIVGLREVILKLISYTIGGISYVLGLPIYWLTLLITTNSGKEDLDSFKQATEKGVTTLGETDPASIQPSLFNYEPILYTLLVVIVIVIIIAVRKKRLDLSQFQSSSISFKTEDNPLNATTLKQRIRSTPPEDEVRKSTYHLEKKAAKYGYHRENGETLSQWFHRLPGYSEERKQLAGVYEKVRYAGESVQEKEVLHYKKGMKNLLKEMKDSKKREENKEQ